MSQPQSMETQMVQNSRNKIGLTFNKFAIKVKRNFNQAQQNHFTFNTFSIKVKTFRFQVYKITTTHNSENTTQVSEFYM